MVWDWTGVWRSLICVNGPAALGLWRALLFIYSQDSNCPWCLVRLPSGDIGSGLFTEFTIGRGNLILDQRSLYWHTELQPWTKTPSQIIWDWIYINAVCRSVLLFSVYWLNVILIMRSDNKLGRISCSILTRVSPRTPLLYDTSHDSVKHSDTDGTEKDFTHQTVSSSPISSKAPSQIILIHQVKKVQSFYHSFDMNMKIIQYQC